MCNILKYHIYNIFIHLHPALNIYKSLYFIWPWPWDLATCNNEETLKTSKTSKFKCGSVLIVRSFQGHLEGDRWRKSEIRSGQFTFSLIALTVTWSNGLWIDDILLSDRFMIHECAWIWCMIRGILDLYDNKRSWVTEWNVVWPRLIQGGHH